MLYDLLRLPSSQPFIREFHFDSQLLLQARRKVCRFIRHFARFTRDMHRVAHENTRDTLLSANFSQAVEIVAAIRARESDKRLRRHLELVG
ncbi:MAG: hypothetical protein WCA00_13220 [Candidatus Acidiferrales bacterium]